LGTRVRAQDKWGAPIEGIISEVPGLYEVGYLTNHGKRDEVLIRVSVEKEFINEQWSPVTTWKVAGTGPHVRQDLHYIKSVTEILSRDRTECLVHNYEAIRVLGLLKEIWYEKS